MLVLASIVAAVLAALSVVGAIAEVLVGRKATKAYGVLLLAEGNDIPSARQAYWRLRYWEVRIAFLLIGCYAVGLIALMPLKPVTGLNLISLATLSFAVVGTGIFTGFKNDVQSKLEMQAETVRRERDHPRL